MFLLLNSECLFAYVNSGTEPTLVKPIVPSEQNLESDWPKAGKAICPKVAKEMFVFQLSLLLVSSHGAHQKDGKARQVAIQINVHIVQLRKPAVAEASREVS